MVTVNGAASREWTGMDGDMLFGGINGVRSVVIVNGKDCLDGNL